SFRGLLSVHSRYGLHAREVARGDLFSSKASAVSLPPLPLRLLPAGATLCRVGITPTEVSRLCTAHPFRELGTRSSLRRSRGNGLRHPGRYAEPRLFRLLLAPSVAVCFLGFRADARRFSARVSCLTSRALSFIFSVSSA